MAKTANEELRDALIRHQTYLLRFSGALRNKIWDILDATEEDVGDRVRSRLAASTGLNVPVELRRLESLVASISLIRDRAWSEVDDVLKEEIVNLSLAESVSINDTVKITMPVQITTAMPTTRLLKSIALERPFQGSILGEWTENMRAADLRNLSNAVQLGMVAGEDMATVARRVVGTNLLGGADGATELTRKQVAALVRTAVMHVSNASRSAYFHENSDIITEEQFVATLDSRTTPVCRANDGKLFPLGEGPVPPLHFNCRSLRIAAIDGTLLGDRPAKPFVEKELVSEYAKDNDLGDITSRSDLPHGFKGDYDTWARGRVRELIGPVPATTTYQTWLEKQSVTFQNDTLGVTKGKLFRDGELKLDKFVNRNGDELTLHELALTEKAAFRAAGLNPDEF